MPMYDYQCSECNHRFEIRQSFQDEPLTICPECTGRVRRVMHPAGVIFKGSGWYITDSRKPSNADAPVAPKSSEASETTSTPVKSAPEASTSESAKAAD